MLKLEALFAKPQFNGCIPQLLSLKPTSHSPISKVISKSHKRPTQSFMMNKGRPIHSFAAAG